MTNLLFQDLSESIIDEILSWDPAYATQLGWHRYDHEVKTVSPDIFSEQTKRLRQFISELDKFDDASISPNERLDKDLAKYLFEIRIFEIEKLRMHEHMCMVPDEICNSLFFLFVRDDIPFEERFDAIASRLEKFPRFIEESKSILKDPLKICNEVTLETGVRLPAFLAEIVMVAKKMAKDDGIVARLEIAVDRCNQAIESYNRWLKDEVIPHSHEGSILTEEEFQEYLELRSYGITVDEALEVAETYFQTIKKEMAEISKEIVDTCDPIDARNKMRSNHPKNFEELLKAYRTEIDRSRQFVIENDIATVPYGEKLLVIETPVFMRHTAPFAAQYEPAKFSTDMKGLFMVTPDDDPEHLMDHAFGTITNTAVHEGYPGHHLQGIVANANPSYLRALSASMDFGEGWALYCEEMMMAQGFSSTPIERLAQLNDLVFRIVRVIADVRLSTGRTTTEEVTDLLVKEVGLQRKAAMNDVRTYAITPTYYLSYFIGKLNILQLRDDVKELMGDKFTLRFFHDTLLRSGTLPMKFMRRSMAIRLHDEYEMELSEPKESLYAYAMRNARRTKT